MMMKPNFVMLALVFFVSNIALADTYLSKPSAETQPANPSGLDSPEEKTLMDHEAIVYLVNGSVEIMKKGTDAWQPLTVGAKINEGDQIKTAAGAFTDIYYDSFYLDTVRIDENTMAEFQTIEPTNLVLTDGKLFNLLDGLPDGSAYKVATPTAVASVRGTRFVTTYQAESLQNHTAVTHGTVNVGSVAHPDQSFVVDAMQTLNLDNEKLEKGLGKEIKVEEMSDEDADAIENIMEGSRMHLIKHVGGPDEFLEAVGKWQKIKNNPDKSRLLKEFFEQSGVNEMSSGSEASGEIKKEDVIFNSQVVNATKDELHQQAMVGAIETYTGKSSEDKE